MKKILLALAFIAVFTPNKAHAIYIGEASPAISAATCATTYVGLVGVPALMLAIASGIDPWTPFFKKVEYTYPK